MTWLITGGCGFVGSNLADFLLSSKEDVVVFDNLSRAGSHENLNWLQTKHGSHWRFIEADIRNEETVLKLIGEIRPKVIAHLAGQVAMTTSLQNPRDD
ncbi:MAG TPA: GDP-mannose 4,6-dehydratase, partial [Anaerolineales bacterium]|nr:GDP-mannose 4,6-dehydratase [Anaerolineales bacterium]